MTRDRTARRAPRDESAFDRHLLAPMILGAILNPVNSSMLAVALVPIGLAFGASPADTAWLVTALYIATAVGQPVVGRLVDRYGPRPLYLASTALVGVGGVVGALAPGLGWLIVARVLIGFGTCAGYPAAMYLVRSEARRTGRDSPAGVLSALAVSTQVISVIGPSLGGMLIGVGGWRAIFWVNVPLAVACLVLGWLRLPRDLGPSRTATDGTPARSTALDLPGMVLFAAALVAAMFFLMDPEVHELWLLALAAVLAAVLVRRELRVEDPFIDLRLLGGNVPLLMTYARQLLTSVVSYAFLYGFTQWLESGRGLTPSQAGLLLLPMSAAAIVVTVLTGRRPEVRGKLVVGAVAQVVLCAALLWVDATTAIWVLVAIAVLRGLPQGLVGLANQNALYHQAEPERIGSSAGLLRTFTYLGALGASAATAAFFSDGATTAGMHDLAWFTVVCSVLMLVVTLVDRSLRTTGRRRTTVPTETSTPSSTPATEGSTP